jgi:sulfite reductase (NADPH) flavoprotein alpha-component
MQIPDTAPFTEEQREALNRLLPTISPSQLHWLTGFIAGVEAALRQPGLSPAVALAGSGVTSVDLLPMGPTLSSPGGGGSRPSAEAPGLAIVFGSESGNAEGLARVAAKEAAKRGLRATVADLAERSVEQLARESNLLVITSTWGDGDPPENAVALHAALMGPGAPSFSGVSYAVCGLGDTSYDKFCQTGKDFDRRLEELGARRFHPRVDCDTDYEGPFRAWLDGVLAELAGAAGASGNGSAPVAVPGRVAPPAAEYGKKHPFPAPLKDKILLNGRGSEKEVWHHELSLAGSGLTYEPGDSLAVIPCNRDEDVADVLEAAALAGTSVVVDGVSRSVADALRASYDCTGLTKPFLAKYNERAGSERLAGLLADAEATRQYLHGRQIADALRDFPLPGLAPEEFLSLLRKMPPRLYSIASSLRVHPEEVHLTVAAVRYQAHGRDRVGVASTFLADRVAVGGTVPVYVAPNKHFKLPADPDVPIIMVGPGTGVAPFRAFVQERQAVGAKGRNWLFFGDQRYSLDFLYQLEWQEALRDGVLTRLDVAFSRDQKQKVYVQHRMLEQAAELWRWLQDGACFYVCGDASRMAGDVHETLIGIAGTVGGMTREAAEGYVEDLRRAKRYLRDVY